jgi:hypothetical protein
MITSMPLPVLLGLFFALVVFWYLATNASRKRLPPCAPSTIPYFDHIRGFVAGGERLYKIMK